MEIKTLERNGAVIAVVNSPDVLIRDVQSALDLFMSVRYEAGSSRIALNKEAVTEEFFVLSTRLAGEILQKFVNYQTKLALFGDFSHYTSKPLRDFIYESNQGSDVFFVSDEAEAVDRLARAGGGRG